MESTSRDRVAELWPDLADDLAAVVPDGCFAVRVADEWIQQKDDAGNRLRTLDLARPVGGAELEELASAARERATAAGWRQIHREDELRQDVFRRTVRQLVKQVPQFLRVWFGEVELPGARCATLRIDHEAGWSRDRIRPELEQRMLHDLVRNRWQLSAPERVNRRETIYDLRDLGEPAMLIQSIELPIAADLRPLLAAHGLSPASPDADDRWLGRERFTKGELVTAVSLGDGKAIVAAELDRTARLR